MQCDSDCPSLLLGFCNGGACLCSVAARSIIDVGRMCALKVPGQMTWWWHWWNKQMNVSIKVFFESQLAVHNQMLWLFRVSIKQFVNCQARVVRFSAGWQICGGGPGAAAAFNFTPHRRESDSRDSDKACSNQGHQNVIVSFIGPKQGLIGV